MSKMGQYVQELTEGQPEPMEPDPEYGERKDWQNNLDNDPGYNEFLITEANNMRKRKW